MEDTHCSVGSNIVEYFHWTQTSLSNDLFIDSSYWHTYEGTNTVNGNVL